MKLEELKGKPKRKYVRKQKDILNTFLLNNDNDMSTLLTPNESKSSDDNSSIYNNVDIHNTIDNNDIMNDLDNEINENLVKSIKRMKLNPEKEENVDTIKKNIELLSTINLIKPIKVIRIEKIYYNPNVLNVKDYEFMNPINVYLYYVSEKIGKNVTKYVTYTHIYKKIDHHILCSTTTPSNYNAKESIIKKEEIIMLAHNVKLYIREYTQSIRNYTYENCQKTLNKKRKKEDIKNGFEYDYCQLHIEGLEYKHKNSYIFEHEYKYFMFDYNIYNNEIKEIKLLTNDD